MSDMIKNLSREFSISETATNQTIHLFKDGASVPFVARYRKEATAGMDDSQLRRFHERWQYLCDFEQRQQQILTLLTEQKQLTPALKHALLHSLTKSQLEELYAPYKTQRKSKADTAREQGLQPLAEEVWGMWNQWNEQRCYLWCKEHKVALETASVKQAVFEIISEALSLYPPLIQAARRCLTQNGVVNSRVLRGKKAAGEKYQDYFEYQEAVKKIPSHRIMALFRGKKEGFLKLNIELDNDNGAMPYSVIPHIQGFQLASAPFPSNATLTALQKECLTYAWTNKIQPKVESEIFSELKLCAETGAIQVFSDNLSDLLMAAPAGHKCVLGLDPGFKNGVKLAVVDQQGQCVQHGVIYPHPPQNSVTAANQLLTQLINDFQIELIAIGNGTGSRETDQLVRSLIQQHNLPCQAVMVSEAGASVYSASPIASQEFPDLDVTIRGAISIARRLQDPLAELVKIEPQAIGVGQYQHDLKNSALTSALATVVEDCVNRVGVELNLASMSLLSHVSGLTPRLAGNIVAYREKHGHFSSRQQLKKITGIGEKCFEQCAGFLRIAQAQNPLDASGVHPESYTLVAKMAELVCHPIQELIENTPLLEQIKQQQAAFSGVDEFTFNDVLQELQKPGRDPRPKFQYAKFNQAVQKIDDLKEKMQLEGTITNVAAFGAFVDIGVHQDGLIHISQLANRFIKDPRELVKIGDVVQVEVLEVDAQRKRISLKALGL